MLSFSAHRWCIHCIPFEGEFRRVSFLLDIYCLLSICSVAFTPQLLVPLDRSKKVLVGEMASLLVVVVPMMILPRRIQQRTRCELVAQEGKDVVQNLLNAVVP